MSQGLIECVHGPRFGIILPCFIRSYLERLVHVNVERPAECLALNNLIDGI